MSNNEKTNLMNKEDIISMFLGLAIVGVVMLVLINYFKSRSGRVDLGGVTDVSLVENENRDEKKQLEDGVDEAGLTMTSGGIYEVVAGDSLWKIAQRRFNDGYRWVEIARLNDIDETRASYLEIGQKLKLPEIAKVELPTEHVVVRGESLSKISLNYYGDMFVWEKIWRANESIIQNPDLIDVGMKLIIPE